MISMTAQLPFRSRREPFFYPGFTKRRNENMTTLEKSPEETFANLGSAQTQDPGDLPTTDADATLDVSACAILDLVHGKANA
jgi:hypothetical protein